MKILLLTGLIISGLTWGPPLSMADVFQTATLSLAAGLSDEQWHAAAAIEYRRLALSTGSQNQEAVYYWMAAWHYSQLADFDLAEKMMHRAEAADWQLGWQLDLLRGENAFQRNHNSEAVFFMTALQSAGDSGDEVRAYTARRLAVIALRDRRPEAAAENLMTARAPTAPKTAAAADNNDTYAGPQALADYQSGRDKNPRLGGLLGLLPGLGYVYAGEYANGLRSLLLNGIFLYGMADSAQRRSWGVFTVISFFELTWYTGSIYGGIDAAHRYNRRRLEDAERDIMGAAAFEPLPAKLPVLELKFDF